MTHIRKLIQTLVADALHDGEIPNPIEIASLARGSLSKSEINHQAELALRQIVRTILNRKSEEQPMIPDLLPSRIEEQGYVERDKISWADWRWIINRTRKEAASKLKYADALEEWGAETNGWNINVNPEA